MLDYRLVQALDAVLTQGGFEKAAQSLYLTQSAVSRRIKQLEAQLGQMVLQRTTPPKATLAGQRLLHHYQQVRQMEAALGLSSADEKQSIRLAMNADSLATWVTEALLLPDHPGVRFDLVVEDQSVGLNRMKQGDVMACICASPEAVNGGAVVALGALRYRAVASPAFIRRYQLDSASPVQLASLPCLVFNEDDQLQHLYLRQYCGELPQHIHYCPSSEGFLKACLAGLGYGLLPELQMQQEFAEGRLVDLSPQLYLDVPLYWHHWQTESPLLQQLREQVQQVATKTLRHL